MDNNFNEDSNEEGMSFCCKDRKRVVYRRFFNGKNDYFQV